MTMLDNFLAAMATLDDDLQSTVTAKSALYASRQGHRPEEEDYILEFQQWSTYTGWNDSALRFQFRFGLCELLKDELTHVGVPETLVGLFALVIQIDR